MHVCARLLRDALNRERDYRRTQRQTSPRHDEVSIDKGAFRMLTLKLGQVNIPMIVTNHTYDVIGAYVPTKEMEVAVVSSMPLLPSFICPRRRRKTAPMSLETLSRQRLLSRVKLRRTRMSRYVFIMMSVVLIDIMVFLNSVRLADFGRTLLVDKK